jgi:signal transduction histidine kinase
LTKILHHGKRADSIVKGMLQHSRKSNGIKELIDINLLIDEYLRLAYHGLRAKDKSFNASFKTDVDDTIEKINVVPQDIGRVLLNLITNAFHAVDAKKKSLLEMNSDIKYEPLVIVSSRKIKEEKKNGVLIQIMDNGKGIADEHLEKIFQPFFTTKPTGQGTGLGLSIGYDIVTKGHQGELKVDTKLGEGATFSVYLPYNV